jgi:hypothetical protein
MQLSVQQLSHTYASSYPDPIRTAVLASLPPYERAKVSSCRSGLGCNSIYCPSCLQRAGLRQQTQVSQAASRIGRPLKFGTFTGLDVPIEGLREASQTLMQTARTVSSRLAPAGSAIRLEVSDPMTENFHAHAHAILVTPSGGRNFVSEDDWQNEWLSELPQWLHPVEGGAHVEAIRNLGATCNYLTQSAYAKCADASRETIRRVLDSITATKGLQKFKMRGSFRFLAAA